MNFQHSAFPLCSKIFHCDKKMKADNKLILKAILFIFVGIPDLFLFLGSLFLLLFEFTNPADDISYIMI